MPEFYGVQNRACASDSTMIRVIRICRKCGAKIFSDVPEGLCPRCVLKSALGNFPDASVADVESPCAVDEPGSPSQAEIAARMGMTENAIRQAFYRFRQRYQSLLREEIANTVATPGDIEHELRHLITVLEA